MWSVTTHATSNSCVPTHLFAAEDPQLSAHTIVRHMAGQPFHLHIYAGCGVAFRASHSTQVEQRTLWVQGVYMRLREQVVSPQGGLRYLMQDAPPSRCRRNSSIFCSARCFIASGFRWVRSEPHFLEVDRIPMLRVGRDSRHRRRRPHSRTWHRFSSKSWTAECGNNFEATLVLKFGPLPIPDRPPQGAHRS